MLIATSGHVSFQLNSETFVLPFHVILVRMVKSYKSHCKVLIFYKKADRRKQTNRIYNTVLLPHPNIGF